MPLINLTQEFKTLVDVEDVDFLFSFPFGAWRYRGGYAVCSEKGKTVGRQTFWMHRVIWERHNGPIPAGVEIDHVDGCGRNNKLSNLRLATHAQNISNSSGHSDCELGVKGILVVPKTGMYKVRIQGKHVGHYLTIKKAAEAYNVAAKELFGQFARLIDLDNLSVKNGSTRASLESQVEEFF